MAEKEKEDADKEKTSSAFDPIGRLLKSFDPANSPYLYILAASGFFTWASNFTLNGFYWLAVTILFAGFSLIAGGSVLSTPSRVKDEAEQRQEIRLAGTLALLWCIYLLFLVAHDGKEERRQLVMFCTIAIQALWLSLLMYRVNHNGFAPEDINYFQLILWQVILLTTATWLLVNSLEDLGHLFSMFAPVKDEKNDEKVNLWSLLKALLRDATGTNVEACNLWCSAFFYAQWIYSFRWVQRCFWPNRQRSSRPDAVSVDDAKSGK